MNLLTMVRLRQHQNKVWYIHYSRTNRKSLGTKDKALAERLFRRARQEYLENKITALTGGPAPKSLIDFWEEYEEHRFKTAARFTCQADKQAFRVFLKALGPDTNLTRITRRQVEQSLAGIAQTVSRTSANTWFRHFKAALNVAVAWGYLVTNPCQGVKQLSVQAGFPRYLSRDEVHRILAAESDPDFRLLWKFYLLTGCRRSEALEVTVKDVDCSGGKIYLGQTKNHQARYAFINEELAEVLWEVLPDVGKLFAWRPDSVTHHFAGTSQKAGLTCRLHDLRHTYGSWLAMAGVRLQAIKDLLGHQDIKTTLIYAHLSQEHLGEAAEKMRIGEK